LLSRSWRRRMLNEALLEIQERWKVDVASRDSGRYTESIRQGRGVTYGRNQETGGGRRMKQIYWKCVDCQSMINDENMHEVDLSTMAGARLYAEFCYGCMNYHPEVVLAYD
jgi:hypothetical protein